MFTCSYISNCLPEDLRELKIASLFFEKVRLYKNFVVTLDKPDDKDIRYATVRGVHVCYNDDFSFSVKPLADGGILEIEEFNDISIEPFEPEPNYREPNEHEIFIFNETKRVMNEVGNKLWKAIEENGHGSIHIHKEVCRIHNMYLHELKVGSHFDFEFIYKYYRNLIYQSIMEIHTGRNLILSSDIVDIYFRKYLCNQINRKVTQYGKPNIGFNAIKQFVPDVSNLETDDILYLRDKLNDELLRYRHFCDKLNEQIIQMTNVEELTNNIEVITRKNIEPALVDLKDKIINSRLNIASKFIDQLKNPSSYVPFLGSIFINIPAHIAAMGSLAIISGSVIIDAIKSRREISSNGLYFLFDLKRNIERL